ncbi:Long-Chain-Fatty-Acid--Coa Ligase Acsbg2 [Manis pentadactyla]|nr:Long-Chain-Fatty-Acid--Coa Ligase Acsbg2 [Manis pentadactyla]
MALGKPLWASSVGGKFYLGALKGHLMTENSIPSRSVAGFQGEVCKGVSGSIPGLLVGTASTCGVLQLSLSYDVDADTFLQTKKAVHGLGEVFLWGSHRKHHVMETIIRSISIRGVASGTKPKKAVTEPGWHSGD